LSSEKIVEAKVVIVDEEEGETRVSSVRLGTVTFFFLGEEEEEGEDKESNDENSLSEMNGLLRIILDKGEEEEEDEGEEEG
jgi:hypothetical protein